MHQAYHLHSINIKYCLYCLIIYDYLNIFLSVAFQHCISLTGLCIKHNNCIVSNTYTLSFQYLIIYNCFQVYIFCYQEPHNIFEN